MDNTIDYEVKFGNPSVIVNEENLNDGINYMNSLEAPSSMDVFEYLQEDQTKSWDKISKKTMLSLVGFTKQVRKYGTWLKKQEKLMKDGIPFGFPKTWHPAPSSRASSNQSTPKKDRTLTGTPKQLEKRNNPNLQNAKNANGNW